MTNEELDRLEARVDAAAEWMQRGRMMPFDGFNEARDLAVEQNKALMAEVRRLRGLVEAAFFEAGDMNGPGVNDWEWERSESRARLDGAP